MMQPAGYHLAHLNWGRLRYGWDDPRTAPFSNAIDTVNQIAERSDGFLWRLQDEAMEAEQVGPDGAFGGDPLVASTLSIWRDAASFVQFVRHTVHARFMTRAGEWFLPGESGLVLWWCHKTARPTVQDGLMRHRMMCEIGPSSDAFGWAELGYPDQRSVRRQI